VFENGPLIIHVGGGDALVGGVNGVVALATEKAAP
jgi:hypothetical protein